jgi:hypothetical protein
MQLTSVACAFFVPHYCSSPLEKLLTAFYESPLPLEVRCRHHQTIHRASTYIRTWEVWQSAVHPPVPLCTRSFVYIIVEQMFWDSSEEFEDRSYALALPEEFEACSKHASMCSEKVSTYWTLRRRFSRKRLGNGVPFHCFAPIQRP